MSKKSVALSPLIIILLLATAFVVAMRLKFRPVQDQVRRFARDYGNPRAMETAGQAGETFSVVHHTGRSSGVPYATPVEAASTEDGFVIALPYGRSPDWLKNVLAAGSATIVDDGHEFPVNQPEIVPAAIGNPYFPRNNQLTHRLFAVDEFLRLHHDEPGETGR